MDKPINQITAFKSLEDLKNYLEERPQLNLGIMMDRNNTTLLHFSAFNNDLLKMKIFINHYKQFTQLNHGTGLYTGETTFSAKLRAWVNSPNKEGYIPIHYAALHGNLQMMAFLEELGTNMQYKTTKGQNLLFMCVQKNSIKALIYLIQSSHHFNLLEGNNKQETILHLASVRGYCDIVSYLLTVGADIDAVDSEGRTPLIVATEENKKQAIKVLLIKGANRESQNNIGQKAIDIAKQNGKQEIVKILFNEFQFLERVKIKCNKKIVYEPEQPSYSFSFLFIFIFHLFFLPVNILSEFHLQKKYIKVIPLGAEAIYEIIIIILYLLLIRKCKKRVPFDLLQLPRPFCSQCRRRLHKNMYHCYICGRCINRYDHHCPWINNCVGSHNIGKFALFLLFLFLGLFEVIFCSICLLIGSDSIVDYRQKFQIPNGFHIFINIVTILFGVLIMVAILNLLIEQLKNLATNSTGYERRKKQIVDAKKSQLLSSDSFLQSDSIRHSKIEEEQEDSSCFGNCIKMLSSPS